MGSTTTICLCQNLQEGSKAIATPTPIEEVEKRLRSKMKVQPAEMMKMMGHSGSSSAAALIKDSMSSFTEHI